ncbi:PQQ-binding-like beta-propeller repeat protein [Paenibacillus pabuli]|uniref:outer membrane protein assembly factor BamB family protein n=1 Tax=Paenibacillus pabuli TaxID=1472 RepID=UPI003CF22FD8
MLISKTSKPFTTLKGQLLRCIVTSCTAAGLIALGATAAIPSQAHADAPDVSVRNWYSDTGISVPELKPSWTAQVDNYLDMNEPYIGHQAIAEHGKVFTFAATKLISIDAKTGKRLWSYGKGLTPYIVYHNDVIYGLNGDHKPYALNAKTGKAIWQSASSTWIDTQYRTEMLVPTGDTLYVIKSSTTFAFDMKTGKLRWKVDEPLGEGNGTDYLEESNDVVLRTFFVQGALTSIQLNAYDKKTGKKLWDDFGQGEALQIKDGLVYSVDYHSSLLTDYQSAPERKVNVNVYNLKTGVQKGSLEYNWKMKGDPPFDYGYGSVFATNGKLYIEQGDQIAEYNFDKYTANTDPLRTYQRPFYKENGQLLGIVQERLVYKNETTGEVAGIKLANGQKVKWYGDAPVAQISVYGKGIYGAQRNGTLLGINMLTATPVFRVNTGGDLHEATLKTDGMIIIQSEGKLLGVKLPASLR